MCRLHTCRMTTRCHFLLHSSLQSGIYCYYSAQADSHFTIPWRVEGWVLTVQLYLSISDTEVRHVTSWSLLLRVNTAWNCLSIMQMWCKYYANICKYCVHINNRWDAVTPGCSSFEGWRSQEAARRRSERRGTRQLWTNSVACCYWSRCSRRLSGTLCLLLLEPMLEASFRYFMFPMLEASFRYFMFNLVMQFYMYTHAWLVWLNQPVSVMKNLLELVKWAFKGSGFYPPKSRVKIGLIPPPFLKLPLSPLPPAAIKKHFGAKCSADVKMHYINFIKRIFPLFFTGHRLSPPCIGIEGTISRSWPQTSLTWWWGKNSIYSEIVRLLLSYWFRRHVWWVILDYFDWIFIYFVTFKLQMPATVYMLYRS